MLRFGSIQDVASDLERVVCRSLELASLDPVQAELPERRADGLMTLKAPRAVFQVRKNR